jgi:hypothetical protein
MPIDGCYTGGIVERGTHEQLLMTNGTYSKLWNIQLATETSGSDTERDELEANL